MRRVEIEPDSDSDRPGEAERFVAAVEEGIADTDAGRLRDHEEVVARMRARIGAKLERDRLVKKTSSPRSR